MDFIVYGIDYHHKPGEFCLKKVSSYYFISCFRTDFIAEIGDVTVRGKAGDYLILEPGQIVYHGPTPEATKGFRNDWLHIGGDDLRELLAKYPLPLNTPFHVDGSFYLASAIEKIHRERSFLLPGYQDKCDMIMTGALIDIYRAFARSNQVTPENKLEYARGEIMKEYQKQWNLEDMAKLSGYSPSRFLALYREFYGTSPVNDLIQYRIEQAKRLMLYGNMRLNDIAEAVGFSSIYYFSKCFRKTVGVSPTVYKRNNLS